jgi:excisionase family DNA binding protein
MGRRRVGFGVEETAPLFARIPKSEAEKLSRAARTLGTSKQRIIAGLLAEHLEPLAPGAHEFRPLAAQPEVLTLEEAADFLRSAPAAVEELALGGELPARRIGGEWRFARTAVLDWLRGWDQAARGSGTSPRARPASR